MIYITWQQIKEKLEKLEVQIIGRSDIGKDINNFSGQVAEDLFSFLIENNMNRYIFDVILRHGSLDVNNFPFGLKFLKSDIVESKTKESFIKKYECSSCKHILFRSHLNEIGFGETFNKRCPICDKVNEFDYQDLEDDFEINRNDLVKFIENLADIGVISKKLKLICLKCKREDDFEEQNINLKCTTCKNKQEIKFTYSFNNDFLKNALKLKDGRWFEWYVYKLNSFIHDYVDHNLIIKFERNGIPREREIDVICLDKKQDLFVFECKDNLLKETDFGDMENIPGLSLVFDNIILVSSNKIKNKSKKRFGEFFPKEIVFIEGSDLEKQFASKERVLELLLNEPTYNVIRLFNKLTDNKKVFIVSNLIPKILESEGKDGQLLNVLSQIILSVKNSSKLFNNSLDRLKDIVKFCIRNIQENKLTPRSVDYIDNFRIRFSREVLLEIVDINLLLSIGIPFLNTDSLSGYSERRPFYYFYRGLLEGIVFFNKYDDEILQNFFHKFIPMVNVYYGDYNRRGTLSIIKNHWSLLNQKNKDKFGLELLSIIKQERWNKYISPEMVNLIKRYFNEFSGRHQTLIKTSLKEFVEKNRKGKEFVERILNSI